MTARRSQRGPVQEFKAEPDEPGLAQPSASGAANELAVADQGVMRLGPFVGPVAGPSARWLSGRAARSPGPRRVPRRCLRR